MTVANVKVTEVLIKRGNTAQVASYVGPLSELVHDIETNSVYVQDGSTPGGHLVGGGGGSVDLSGVYASLIAANAAIISANTAMKGYVDAQISTINAGTYGNTQVAEYLLGTVTTGNIVPEANVTYSLGSPSRQWQSLYLSSNTIFIGGQVLSVSGSQLSLNGTVVNTPTYSNANVASYLPTSSVITGINANITGANAAIVTANTAMKGYVDAVTTAWKANAVSQETEISSLRANITAANSAIISANSYNQSYTTSAISTAINNLINSAPGTLDTLGEIAANLATEGSAVSAILNGITSTNANVSAANLQIASLQSNLAAQVSVINTLQGEVYSNTNTAAYLAANPISSLVANGHTAYLDGNDGKFHIPGYLILPNGEIRTGNDGGPTIDAASTGQGVTLSSNSTQFKWYFGPDGHLTLPDTSSFWGGLHVAGAGYFSGLANNNLSQQINVEDAGIWLHTSTDNANEQFHSWRFGLDGNITFPDGSNQTTAWTGLDSVVTVGNTSSNSTAGSLWYNTDDGRTYIRAFDTWIDASPATIPAPNTYLGDLDITGNVITFPNGTLTVDGTGNLLVNGSPVVGSGGSNYTDGNVVSLLGSFGNHGISTTGTITAGAINMSGSITWGGGSSVYEDSVLVAQGGQAVSINSPGWTQITAGTTTWTFATDSSFTAPGVVAFNSTAVGGPNTAGGNRINLYPGQPQYAIGIDSATTWISSANYVDIYAGSSVWNYGSDGRLIAPSTIVLPEGSTAGLAFGTSGSYSSTVSVDSTSGNLTVEASGAQILQVSGNEKFVSTNSFTKLVATSDIYLISNRGFGDKLWTLDSTGNLIIPGNINYANGQSILSGISSSSNGNITLPNGSTIVEIASPTGVGQSILLTPYGGSAPTQQLRIYPTMAEGDHVHLTSGDLTQTSIFLGSDSQYIRTQTDGSMIVGTDVTLPDTSGNGYQWVFGVDGNFTLPGPVHIPANGDGLTFADINHSIRQTGNSTEYHEWGDTLANGGGHKFFTNGGRDSQTLQLQIANDGIQLNANTTVGNLRLTGGLSFADGSALPTGYVTPPTVASGQAGDTAGQIAIDSNYIYYCAANYVDQHYSATSNTLYTQDGVWHINKGSYPTPQVGWTITGTSYPPVSGFTTTITGVADEGGTWGIRGAGIGNNGVIDSQPVVFFDPSPGPAIWKTVPITAFEFAGYGNANVAAYLSGNTTTVANLIVSGSAPSLSTGSSGDTAGMIRVDNNYLYYCTTTWVPNSYTVNWLGSVGNILFIPKGSYPTPQVGWTITYSTYTLTISNVQTYGGDSSVWELTFSGGGLSSPSGGTATLTNPTQSVIWKTIPLTAFGNVLYGNANVASYLTANPQSGTYSNSNVATYLSGNITVGNVTTNKVTGNVFAFANGVNILSTVTSTYGNANVASYLTANPQSGTYSNVNVAAFLSNSTASTGNIYAGNVIANQYGNSIGTTATYTGNVTANYLIGNISAASNISTTGNLIASNVIISNTFTVANIVTTGTYGNITGANVISANTIVVGGVNLTRATNGYNNWKGNTYANVDNVSCSVFSNGAPAFSSVSGTLNYFWSSITNLTGGKFFGNTNTGGAASTIPLAISSAAILTSGGDTVQLTLQDQTLQRIYNVTYVQTVGTGNCAIVVERVV